MSDIELRRLAAERRARMEMIFVPTPRTQDAHDAFRLLMEHAAVSQRNKMCVLLVAPSQSGKSRLIETFVAENNTADALEARKVPVLHVILSAEVTRKGLAQNILLALQDQGFETGAMKGTELDLWQRVYRYLEVAEVKLLVLDEIHHLKTGSLEMANSVGETIKVALLKGPCPIVLSGIHTAELPFRTNAQLQQRSIPAIRLDRFRPDCPGDLAQFGTFLAEYMVRVEEAGIVNNATALLRGDVPACILEVSRGVLGTACRLLMEAVTVMTLAGRDVLQWEDLEKATDRAFVGANLHDRNPFTSGLGPIRFYGEHDGL